MPRLPKSLTKKADEPTTDIKLDEISRTRRALHVIASYLVDRDQIGPMSADKDIYWIAREFSEQ